MPGRRFRKIKLPCSAKYLLRFHRKKLTPPDIEELSQFEEVYYLGRSVVQNRRLYLNRQLKGCIVKGFYQYVKHEHIAFQYEVLDTLGQGSYGRVFSAYDHKWSREVAIKSIHSRTVMSEVLQETNMSKYFKERGSCEFTVEVYCHFKFHGCLFIVFERLYCDLASIIRPKNSIKFGAKDIKNYGEELMNEYAYNVCRCVLHMKQQRVFHSDIKPKNILLVAKGKPAIKLCDFGVSCFYSEMLLHTVVQTYYYAAPESLLGALPDPAALDLWATACVLAELHIGRPLFLGDNKGDIISVMIGMMGMPPEKFWTYCNPYLVKKIIDNEGFPKYCRKTNPITAKPSPHLRKKRFPPGEMPLIQILLENGDVDMLMYDLLCRCFVWDVEKRLSIEQVMLHPYLQRRVSKYELGSCMPHFQQLRSKLQKFNSSQNLNFRHIDNCSKSGAF